MADWRTAGLDARRSALCLYAEKSTERPASMSEEDLRPLREEGLRDEDLLTLLHVIGFFNGVNRVADGLHVDDEEPLP